MLFTIDEITPAREQRCPPEVLACFVKDVRRFQQAVEKMDDQMDKDIVVAPEDDISFEAEEQRLSHQIDLLDDKVQMAQEWLKHYQLHGVYDDVRSFSTFEMDVRDFRIDLERALIRAEITYRSQPALFHDLATEGKLIPGPFCDVLKIYGLLYRQDDVAAYALHDRDEATGLDGYDRPQMSMVGAWTKKQIGDFLYAVIQEIENPAFLLACLSDWEREVAKELLR